MHTDSKKFLAVIMPVSGANTIYKSFLFHYRDIASTGISVMWAKYRLQEALNQLGLKEYPIGERDVAQALLTSGQDALVCLMYEGATVPMPQTGSENDRTTNPFPDVGPLFEESPDIHPILGQKSRDAPARNLPPIPDIGPLLEKPNLDRMRAVAGLGMAMDYTLTGLCRRDYRINLVGADSLTTANGYAEPAVVDISPGIQWKSKAAAETGYNFLFSCNHILQSLVAKSDGDRQFMIEWP